jgi:uncharacterized hydrophobic protein (TIGR00271 family)
MKRILAAIRFFLRERFSLAQDQDNELEIIDAIRKGVIFRGINLWMLIFAILIASVGLNVNSTAVIIGAMLISPLMGPIMGLGLGAGINDIHLIKTAGKNLAIAVFLSILTSATYFYFTPLTQVQSELLSRTSPTFFDVLIALFGGLAGVFAGSSKEKGNAIPGVAIATALMPPLCTAGYGLATMNMAYFLGALYLFFINSVMISASTFMVVEFLRFKPVEYLDAQRAKFVKRIIYSMLFITIVPSIYLAYNIVKQSKFEIDANTFLRNEFSNESFYVVNKQFSYKNAKNNEIILYIGGFMDSSSIANKHSALENYKLDNTKLVIRQGTQLQDFREKDKIQMDQVSRSHAFELNKRDSTIAMLKEQMNEKEAAFFATSEILDELKVFYPSIREFSISPGIIYSEQDSSEISTIMVYLADDDNMTPKELDNMKLWLKKRLNIKELRIVK